MVHNKDIRKVFCEFYEQLYSVQQCGVGEEGEKKDERIFNESQDPPDNGRKSSSSLRKAP